MALTLCEKLHKLHDQEYWYEDCPVDTTKFNWNKDKEEWQEISIDIPAEVR